MAGHRGQWRDYVANKPKKKRRPNERSGAARRQNERTVAKSPAVRQNATSGGYGSAGGQRTTQRATQRKTAVQKQAGYTPKKYTPTRGSKTSTAASSHKTRQEVNKRKFESKVTNTSKTSNATGKKPSMLEQARKAYEKGKDVTYLGTKQKEEKVKLKDGSELKTVNALTKDEFNRMAYASSQGKKNGDALLKGGKRTGQKDIREKVGSKTAAAAVKSKAATGVMQGVGYADVLNGVGTYNKQAKKAIKEVKESGAYNAGYAAGQMAGFALSGTSSAAKSITKSGAKAAAKGVAKNGAKAVAKAESKAAAKQFAKNRAAEVITETPMNLVDAAKMATDENGKINKKQFIKYAALNTGLTAGAGGALEGLSAAATKKLGNETLELVAKRRAGTITKEESAKLSKNIAKLSKKESGTLAGNTAKKTQTAIRQGDQEHYASRAVAAAKSTGTGRKKITAGTADYVSKVTEQTRKGDNASFAGKAYKAKKLADETTALIAKRRSGKLTASESMKLEQNLAELSKTKQPSAEKIAARESATAKVQELEANVKSLEKKYTSAKIAAARSKKKGSENFPNRVKEKAEAGKALAAARKELNAAKAELKTAENNAPYRALEDDPSVAGLKEDSTVTAKAPAKEVEPKPTARRETALDDVAKLQKEGKVSKIADTKEPKVQQISQQIKKDTSTVKEIATTARRIFVDSFNSWEKVAKSLATDKRNSLLAQINEVRKASKTAMATVSTKGFKIFEDAGLVGKGKAFDERRADFDFYCFLKHDLSRNGRGKPVTGLDDEGIVNAMQALEKKYAEKGELEQLHTFQKQQVEYYRELIQREVDSGITSADDAKWLFETYPDYVPTFRAQEFEGAASIPLKEANLDLRKGMKQATGGNSDLLPLYEQMTAKTNSTFRRTEQNRMVKMVADYLEIDAKEIPDAEPNELLESVSFIYRDSNAHKVMFYRDGKQYTMDISEQMYKGIKEWSGEDKHAMLKFMLGSNKVVGSAAGAFKKLITDYNLLFGIKNHARDIETAMLYSKDTKGWIKAYPKALRALMGDAKYKKYLTAYQENGGIYSQLVTSDNPLKKLNSWQKANPLKWVEEFNSALETIPRLQEFISAVDSSGMDIDKALKNHDVLADAMYRCKDVTLNFDRGGYVGKALNRGLVPFFNPAIQGLDKIGRFLITDNKSAKDFALLGTKLAGMVALPAAATEAIFGGDESYQRLSTYNKDSYYCIRFDFMPKDYYIKIPKAREVAAVQAPMEHFFAKTMYGVDGDWKNMFTYAWQNIGPVNPATDNLISPLFRVVKNETWFGSSIENYDDQQLVKAGKSDQVYDEKTSALAIALGKQEQIKKWGISPKKIDNILDSYLGIFYDMGLKQTSAEAQSTGGGVMKYPKSILKTNFVIDSVFQNRYQADLYTKLSDLEAKQSKYAEGTDEYNKYKIKIQNIKNSYAYDAMTYNDAISSIDSEKGMSGDEKFKLKRKLAQGRNKLLKDFEDGKGWSKNDPLTDIASVFGIDRAINDFTYTDEQEDGSKTNNHKAAYKAFLKNNEPTKKNKKRFFDALIDIRQTATRIGDGKSYVDYTTVAICSAYGRGDSIADAYSVNSETAQRAKNYRDYGYTKGQYIYTAKALTNGAAALGKYRGKLKNHEQAMILGNKGYSDGSYYITNKYLTNTKMYASRYLSAKKYKDIDVSKWANSYKLDYNSSSEEIIDAIERDYGDKSNREKSALYHLFKEDGNPYGNYRKIGNDKDSGIIGSDWYGGYGGRGRRGYGRRGYGRSYGGGSGGSSSFTPESYTAGSVGKFSIPKGKVTDVTKKSNLTDAQRKKRKKLRDSLK